MTTRDYRAPRSAARRNPVAAALRRAGGSTSPTQALALAQAAAIYSGGNDAVEGLRRSLGLGAASNSNDPLNKFLGGRVSLGVHTGATPAQTGVGMSVTIYKQLKAKGAIDATGGASAGVGAEYEW
jgi:translocation and assembly module TamB